MSGPGRRVRLCAKDDLEPCAVRRFVVDGRALALVRTGDRLYAIDDRCSHENYSLSDGDLDCELCEIECPQHGSRFSLLDGSAITLPATAPVQSYEVDVSRDGDVSVVLS